MIKPEQVPEEAVMKAALERWGVNQPTQWEKDTCRIIIAAALNAWPGAEVKTTFWPNDDGVWIVPRHGWLLPLAQKDATDE